MFDMLTLYMPFTFILIYSLAVGFAVNRIVKIVDNAMYYGNIFGFIRYFIVWLFAKDKAKFNFDIQECKDKSLKADLSDNIHLTYKDHSRYLSTGILCTDCFGIWILIPISLFSFWFLHVYMGYDCKYYYFFALFNFIGFKDK